MYDYLDTPNFHRYMEMKKGADFATKLASSYHDPYAGAPYPDPSDWIGPRTFVEHGNTIANYTNFWGLDCSSWYWGLTGSSSRYYFNKILVLTSGDCGSSCSQMISRMQENGVKVVGWGGVKEMPMDISSYNGGEVKQLSNEFTKYPVFKTTADLRWNFNEMYVRSNTEMPREFLRLEPDFRVNNLFMELFVDGKMNHKNPYYLSLLTATADFFNSMPKTNLPPVPTRTEPDLSLSDE